MRGGREVGLNPKGAARSVLFQRLTCLCSSGRNLKNFVIENSRISGSPLSRLAPARKSSVGSLLSAGVSDREFRRLPGQDFRLLEQRVFQDAPSPIFMASVK